MHPFPSWFIGKLKVWFIGKLEVSFLGRVCRRREPRFSFPGPNESAIVQATGVATTRFTSASILLPAIVVYLLLADATPGRSKEVVPSQTKHPAVPSLAVESEAKANALADKLIRLDKAAMKEFEHQHPGTLPELKLSLPKANAAQFDWCNLNKVCEPRRQLTGDCWANAATEALECNYLIRNDRRLTLSVQPLLDTLKLGTDDKNRGGAPATALNFFLKIGTASIQNYPYTGEPSTPRDTPLPYRAVAWGYVRVDGHPPTTEQLKEALLRHGPLVIYVSDTPNFNGYRGGLFEEKTVADAKGCTNPHAVLLVGWDDTRGARGAWKIKNSWGTRWGEQGFMWMARGNNQFGTDATWVRAMSVYYRLGSEFTVLVPDALPLIPRPNSLAASPILSAGGVSAGQLLFAVPEGGPDKLLQFIDNLNLKSSAPGVEKATFEKRKEYAIVEAAERVLAAKPSASEARKACIGKISAIKMLYRVGDPLVEDRLDSLPSELERAGQADLVRTVRCVLLGEKLRRGGHSLESGARTSGGGLPLSGGRWRRHYGLLCGQRSGTGGAQGRRQKRCC